MTRRMLIDASQSEETRVVVLKGNRLEEFDYDSEIKKQLKGNVYLAKVTRVEPSLQAAFVEYGGNRHGFLAFNEIHPDYYKIPVADRQKLIAEEAALDEGEEQEDGDHVETVGGDELEDVERRRARLRRRYKIQEVIKRGQVILVQVVKEERGNKGAALTTYLSLPGRYCVLMPNTARGGGISRKINNMRDRKRLKKVLDDLGIPDGMAVIVRTAGSERTKAEIKRDAEYLLRLWDTIRTDTLDSTAPALIYEEANLIKRAIRDMYTKEIEEVLIEGDDGYRTAKDFMRTLMPSHAKRVQPHKTDGTPMFQHFQVEGQIDAIHSPEVKLRSGGYIVLHQTEALVAIDVNSGRSTRERHIEETALKTNLEAAEEVSRQLRLRDLAGLIVIDFIDMEDSRNNQAVERRLKEALRHDRARIQVGRISHFGLLEMSRQRLRPSLTEMSSELCPHCGGSGYIRSVEWTALYILRAIEEEALRKRSTEMSVSMPGEAALYMLNQKRSKLHDLEIRYGIKILIVADNDIMAPNFSIDIVRGGSGEIMRVETEDRDRDRQGPRKRRSRRRRRSDADTDTAADTQEAADAQASDEREERDDTAEQDGEGQPRRRKRGRRGGRRRNRRSKAAEGNETETVVSEVSDDGEPTAELEAASDDSGMADQPEIEEQPAEEKPKPRRRRPRRRSAKSKETAESESDADTGETTADADDGSKSADAASEGTPEAPADDEAAEGDDAPEKAAAKPKTPRRRSRTTRSRKPKDDSEKPAAEEKAASNGASDSAPAEEAPEPQPSPEPAVAAEPGEEAPPIKPEEPGEKRTGWWNRVVG